jgi:hypothetical protein
MIKKEDEIGRGCGTCGRIREIHTGFWWRNLKESLGRPSHRWEDNVKMDFEEIGLEGMY